MKSDIILWSDQSSPELKALNLELTAHCNYKCAFCLNPRDNFRPKGNISNELIEKIINELSSDVLIYICGIGEPSMHPDFIDIIEKLTRKFYRIRIVTNGYLFRNSELINAILEANIEKITLSLNYINPADYKNIQGGSLEKVIGFIKDFVQRRKKHTNKPFLQVNYIFEKWKNDYMDAYNFLSKIIDDPWEMYIRKIKNIAGQISIDEERNEDVLDNLLERNKHLALENWNRFLSGTNFRTENPKNCRHIYDYYSLLWNGDALPCCVDYNGEMVICNVLSENLNLTDVFYSEKFESFRKKREKLDYKEIPLCEKCNDYYKYSTRYKTASEKLLK